MKNTMRTFALISALTLAATPMMHAEVMGTNPRPQVASMSFLDVAYTMFALYVL
jgi:hypothetical protein